jgi:hypothetical protein
VSLASQRNGGTEAYAEALQIRRDMALAPLWVPAAMSTWTQPMPSPTKRPSRRAEGTEDIDGLQCHGVLRLAGELRQPEQAVDIRVGVDRRGRASC